MQLITIGTILVLFLLLAAGAYMVIWTRRPSNARLFSLLALVPCSIIAGLCVVANLGLPTQCYPGYNIPAGSFNILGFKVIKDERIYILLDTPGSPTSCIIPYSEGTAEGLQEGASNGQGSVAEGGYGNGTHVEGDQPLTIHPRPVEAPPAKEVDGIQL